MSTSISVMQGYLGIQCEHWVGTANGKELSEFEWSRVREWQIPILLWYDETDIYR